MPNELVKQISYILYKADEEDVKVNALLKDESIWLTQNSMAELFDVNVPAVSKHLKNIYECGELDEVSTISILETVQKEGTRSVKRNVTFYNLDAIISVGYRVNSAKATKFRIWATNVLKEYIKKGFVLDDERLKQGEIVFGKDYFRELWKEFAQFVQVNAESGSRLQIFLQSVPLIMIKTLKLQNSFIRLFRISFILQLQVRPRQKLFMTRRTTKKSTWV